jgi:hypothetical protein
VDVETTLSAFDSPDQRRLGLREGVVVGRVMKVHAAPVGEPWL